MGVLNLTLTTGRDNATLARDFESVTSRQAVMTKLINLLNSMNNGCEKSRAVSIAVQGNATQATGTLTLASVVATNTFAINGVTFTAEASGATGNQFNVGVSDTATATNAAAAINASVSSLIAGHVSATSSGAVVTVTSLNFGIFGNAVTLVGGTNITASVARLAGGAADSGTLSIAF